MRYNLLFSLILLISAGCASVPSNRPLVNVPAESTGIYHRTQRGQTLWSISRIYNVDLDDIVRLNHITDASRIESGQLIFIPRSQISQAYKPVPTKSQSFETFIWPLRGKVVSTYGQSYNSMLNKGINIEAFKGHDVLASRSGKVVFVKDDFLSFGKTIIIEHADDFFTIYARNSEIFVKVGDIISRGAVIAKVGSAGRDRNNYLHFEIRKGSGSKNPYFYLP